MADTRNASIEAREFFASFFTAKNQHDVEATMRHFSPQVVTYTDAVLGWPLDGFDAIEGTFRQYMPNWPATALSYPTRILGDATSALVAFSEPARDCATSSAPQAAAASSGSRRRTPPSVAASRRSKSMPTARSVG